MANSDITKQALAQAFARLLEDTTLDRITVTAIAKECGINRQTFYYHFHDVYDLLSWTIETHIDKLLAEVPRRNWQLKLCALLQGLAESKGIVNHLVRTTDVAFVYLLLRDKLKQLTLDEIDCLCADMDIDPGDREMAADFYAGGLLEVVLTWIMNSMQESPEQVVRHLEIVLNGEVLMRLSARRLDESRGPSPTGQALV